MTVPIETLWEIDPHTKAKHEILCRYLKAWFPILNLWNNRIVYIDGFCGPGRYKGGDRGSPLIALDVAVNHRRAMSGELVFWFIDERQDRIAHLQQELKTVSIPTHFKVTAEAGKFHEKLGWVMDCMEANRSDLAPTFAFPGCRHQREETLFLCGSRSTRGLPAFSEGFGDWAGSKRFCRLLRLRRRRNCGSDNPPHRTFLEHTSSRFFEAC